MQESVEVIQEADRALTQGYWWPSMQKEAQDYVKKCDQCQRFTPNIHQLGGVLNPLSFPWSFAQWGLDIVGPFPKAMGNRRWLMVRTNYFTKWVEAKPLSNIRDMDAKKFTWKNIVTHLESLIPLSQTIDSILTVKHSRDVVAKWALEIDIQLQPICKEMNKLKQLTR